MAHIIENGRLKSFVIVSDQYDLVYCATYDAWIEPGIEEARYATRDEAEAAMAECGRDDCRIEPFSVDIA